MEAKFFDEMFDSQVQQPIREPKQLAARNETKAQRKNRLRMESKKKQSA